MVQDRGHKCSFGKSMLHTRFIKCSYIMQALSVLQDIIHTYFQNLVFADLMLFHFYYHYLFFCEILLESWILKYIKHCQVFIFTWSRSFKLGPIMLIVASGWLMVSFHTWLIWCWIFSPPTNWHSDPLMPRCAGPLMFQSSYRNLNPFI